MRGYQADIGVGWWGKLYEENGRGILSDKSGEPYLKKGEWNRYEIEAVGNHIRTWLNGQPCVDFTDTAGARRGIFALQLHALWLWQEPPPTLLLQTQQPKAR